MSEAPNQTVLIIIKIRSVPVVM